jgi:hypothetical protein
MSADYRQKEELEEQEYLERIGIVSYGMCQSVLRMCDQILEIDGQLIEHSVMMNVIISLMLRIELSGKATMERYLPVMMKDFEDRLDKVKRNIGNGPSIH